MSGPFSIFDAASNEHDGCGGGKTFMWAVLDGNERAVAWCSSREEAETIRALLAGEKERTES